MVQAAVERKFEIIGEAIVQARHHFPQEVSKLGEVQDVVNFRNMLVHRYDQIVYETVWRIVQDNLPQLLSRVQILIANYER